jgi:cytidylate kinase
MRERDARDTQRAVAPLVPAEDARVLDSSKMTAQETVQAILDFWNAGAQGGAGIPGSSKGIRPGRNLAPR